MAELGALSLRIQEEGGATVLAKLRQIDSAASLTGSKPIQLGMKVNAADAKAAGQELAATQKFLNQEIENSIQRYQLFGRTVDVGSKQAVAQMRQLTQEQLTYLRTVGASEVQQLKFAAAVQTFEKRVTAAGVAEKTASLSGLAAIERRITLLTKGVAMDATRADAVKRLTAVEAALTSTLARGNATTEQRIALNAALARTQAGIAAGTTDLIVAQTVASERSIASAERSAYAMDRQRTAADKMSPKIRSGASAIAALAIAATTGGGSLAGMATQAGLVGSVMAAEFAPAKWAGYAAGIGAVVIGIVALIGIIRKLNEEAQKPRKVVLTQIGDTNIPEILETRAAELRKERDALDKFILEAKRVGFVSTAGVGEMKRPVVPPAFEGLGPSPKSLREAQNRQKQLEAEFTEANKRLGDILGDRSKEVQTAAIQGIVTAAEATKTVRLSELAKEQAAVEKKFAEGNASLAAQYDERRRVVVEGANAERAAMEAQRAALLKSIPGEDPKGAAVAGRKVEAGAVDKQITALANETAARLTALDAQQAADAKALAAKVLGYQVQLEQFSDTAFQKRMQQIAAEDAERRRSLTQRGNATQQELADLDALLDKQKAQLFLAKAQADLARLREDLALRLQEIENRRLAGLLDEEQASRAIVDITRSALPTLQEAVDRAIALAEKLGEQGVLGQLKAIKTELATPLLLNIDIDTDAITKRLNIALEQIRKAVNTGLLDEKTGRSLVQQQQFAAGFAGAIADSIAAGSVAAFQGKNPLQALAQSLTSSLGSLLVDVGAQWLKASTLMATLQTFFVANPWAAVAAAVAMIALGSAMGGGGGSGAGGGFSGGSTAPTPISISRLVVDPNAGVKQRIASAGMQQAAAAAPHPLVGVALLAVDKPKGAEYLATRVNAYSNRGG